MIKLLLLGVAIFLLLVLLLYFVQERLIFFPEKLGIEHSFSFDQPFEELNFRTNDNITLNGVLFKSLSQKGLIFYLHGNAGSIRSWGEVASTYTDLNYDLFMMDYRGFGKSGGSVTSQRLFYDDVQLAYDSMKSIYDESKIIILGYSLGTGPATKLASENHPQLLLLMAPYYSLTDVAKRTYPFIPMAILKYKFETNKFIKDCKMPIVIFHGKQDEVIYYESSIKLKTHLKNGDKVFILDGQAHNGMTYNPEYISELKQVLK